MRRSAGGGGFSCFCATATGAGCCAGLGGGRVVGAGSAVAILFRPRPSAVSVSAFSFPVTEMPLRIWKRRIAAPGLGALRAGHFTVIESLRLQHALHVADLIAGGGRRQKQGRGEEEGEPFHADAARWTQTPLRQFTRIPPGYIFSIMAVPNSEHLISVAPSMSRAKS